ncbi:MAG: hypothetical protein IJY65_02050 [Clostridia bacterium]|nr:hypothetical protein [Clostridia bacterium]
MNILTYGKDERVELCAAMLGSLEREGRVMLLPVPTSRDGEHIAGCDIPLTEPLREMSADTTVIGYNIPEILRTGCAERFVDLAHDEAFLEENARLTAIGCVGYILSTSKKAPPDQRIGVAGYGRIGRELLRYLLFFGASVRVYTSRESVRRSLAAMGVESTLARYGEGADISGLDIFINTAPAPLLTEESCKAAKSSRIIELASGENIPKCAEVERLMSVPARVYPKSSARLYYECALRALGGGKG